MIYNDNKVMCAVIKVDIKKNSPQFLARTYLIPYDYNIEEIIEYIKIIGQKYNIPITRVYLSGHILSSSNIIWNKKKIDQLFQNNKKLSLSL